jgi:hypothetical protein
MAKKEMEMACSGLECKADSLIIIFVEQSIYIYILRVTFFPNSNFKSHGLVITDEIYKLNGKIVYCKINVKKQQAPQTGIFALRYQI